MLESDCKFALFLHLEVSIYYFYIVVFFKISVQNFIIYYYYYYYYSLPITNGFYNTYICIYKYLHMYSKCL
jgi:hypothetical protein